jgi:hypothetical protein
MPHFRLQFIGKKTHGAHFIYLSRNSCLHFRQEIVAALMTHVCAPTASEVDSAIAVLRRISVDEITSALATSHVTARSAQGHASTRLCNFSAFVKSTLDDVKSFSDSQLRDIFRFSTNHDVWHA